MGFVFKLNKVMILVQGTAELLTKSSVKYKNPKKNVHEVNGLNPFRSRISLSTTWDGYGFYIDYTLTPLFKTGVGNDTIRSHYRLVSRITGDRKVSNFYLYEPDSSKRDMSFVMTVSGPEESVVLEIIGKYDIKDITRLSVIGQKK